MYYNVRLASRASWHALKRNFDNVVFVVLQFHVFKLTNLPVSLGIEINFSKLCLVYSKNQLYYL